MQLNATYVVIPLVTSPPRNKYESYDAQRVCGDFTMKKERTTGVCGVWLLLVCPYSTTFARENGERGTAASGTWAPWTGLAAESAKGGSRHNIAGVIFHVLGTNALPTSSLSVY